MKGDTALALLAACKAQHDALDRLFAHLLELTLKTERPFYPSQSGQPWAAVEQGNAAINQAERELAAKGLAPSKTITIEVSDTVHALLEVLAKSDHGTAGSVEGVLGKLIDHAQQGVYRPGAWERSWLEQAFGDDWQQYLERGDPHGRPGCEHLFQRPKGFRPK